MQQFIGRVIANSGVARENASVTVRIKSSGSLATIYSDQGITAIDNPIATDADGTFKFFAADEDYTVTDDNGFQLGDVTLYDRSADEPTPLVKTDNLPVVNNSTTLVNDGTLAFSIGANETWQFYLVARVTCASAAGFDWKFTIPSGTTSTHKVSRLHQVTPTFPYSWTTALDTEDSYTAGALADTPLVIHGIIENGSNAGTVQFQYAQNTANVSDAYAGIGSRLVARKYTA